MTNSLKTLFATTAVSILMAGAATAQDAQQEAPAPDAAVEAEAVETMEAPSVEIYATETIEGEAVEAESKTETTIKIVEDVESAVDTNTVEASSETPMESDVEADVTLDAEEGEEAEETAEPETK